MEVVCLFFSVRRVFIPCLVCSRWMTCSDMRESLPADACGWVNSRGVVVQLQRWSKQTPQPLTFTSKLKVPYDFPMLFSPSMTFSEINQMYFALLCRKCPLKQQFINTSHGWHVFVLLNIPPDKWNTTRHRFDQELFSGRSTEVFIFG